MSSFFNRVPPLPEKPVSKHPWESRMKPEHLEPMKYAHNSTTSNLKYPNNPNQKNTINQDKKFNNKDTNKHKAKDVFTVIGIKFSKEFIFCRHWVKKLHRFRSKRFSQPLITGITTVDWPKVWNNLKLHYSEAYCIDSPVVVLLNGSYLGGHEQLKEHLEKTFRFHFNFDYKKESLKEFSNLLSSTSRPFVYIHISVDDKPLGTMIFMLYTDIVPITCENFIRLCNETRGGYAGTPVHRIVKDCWIQCGGFGLKSTDMICENFMLDFDKRGVLGMANADRHVDCSTQFFVISQPAPWMKGRYVAFGQLIDGESTFKAIEESPTWYESPTQDIKIYKAGVINLECSYPIAINKNAREYLNSHIDNLYEVGEYFFELLMEKVSNEILLNYLKSIEKTAAEGEEEPVAEIEGKVRSAERFVHKNAYSKDEAEDNNDFDVDSYYYEPEEYDYDQVSPTPSPVIKPDVPFYLALTDVPYPDEVDSNFDMKRFLQGQYCLESDVKKPVPKTYLRTTPHEGSFAIDKSSSSSSSEDTTLDSEDQKEVDDYLRNAGEIMCVSGPTVKKMAFSLTDENILKRFYASDASAFNDEELRKARIFDAEYQQRQLGNRVVSITECQEYSGRKIRRRPTGFLRDEDVAKMIKARIRAGIEGTHESSEEDDDINSSMDSLPKKAKKTKFQPETKTKLKPAGRDQRECTLHRLYSDFAMFDGEKPTLKDYRFATGSDRDIKTPSLFLTASERVQMSIDSIDNTKTIHQEMRRHQGHKRMMEAEAVKEPIVIKAEQSIRSHKFAKTRPSLTVKQYLEKNRTSDGAISSEESRYKRGMGLRLPGDSPLYSDSALISQNHGYPNNS